MKSILVCLALLFSTQIFADDGKIDGEKWEIRKERKLKLMDEIITRVSKNRECVKAATTKKAFKACVKVIKAERKAWKAKHKD